MMKTVDKPQKLLEFETLRAVSIIFLLLVHGGFFFETQLGMDMRPISPFVELFMLGSFFFMTGYFAQSSYHRRESGVLSFLWSRFIRIYPPYWFALALFVFVMRFTLKRFDLYVYLAGLQIIFLPNYVKLLLTLWYVGAIVMYFLIFTPFLSASHSRLAFWAVFVFLACYVIHLRYGLFDDRFFLYYFILLTGIYLARFEELREWLISAPVYLHLALVALSGVLFGAVEFGEYRASSWQYVLTATFAVGCWIPFALKIFRLGPMTWRLWPLVSYASYFAFLCHRPIWHVLVRVFKVPDEDVLWFQWLPGSIITLVVCYFLQWGYDSLLRLGENAWKHTFGSSPAN